MNGENSKSLAEQNHNEQNHVRQLERRYVELLEKRIAELEKLVAKPKDKKSKSEKNEATSDDGEENQDDDESKSGSEDTKPSDPSRRQSVSSASGLSSRTPRIRFRDMKYDKDGVEKESNIDEKDVKSNEKPRGKGKDYVDFLWTRRFDKKNKYIFSEVKIHSAELQDLFQVEFAHDPRMHFSSDTGSSELTLTSPFEPLVHRWKRLNELVDNDCESEVWASVKEGMAKLRTTTTVKFAGVEEDHEDRTIKARENLSVLLQHVRTTPDVNAFINALDTSVNNNTIRFEHLWTLFPPGELVWASPFMKQDQVFVVKECTSAIVHEDDRDSNERKFWYLWCWTYDWNGKTFDRACVYFRFQEYPGAKMINTLACQPLRYRFKDDVEGAKERKTFEETLIARGKKYKDYCSTQPGLQMFDYDGEAISHGSGFQRLKNSANKQSKDDVFFSWFFGRRGGRGNNIDQGEIRPMYGRVMVDALSYIEHAPNIEIHAPIGGTEFSRRDDECHCSACTQNTELRQNQRQDYDEQKGDSEFTNEQYLLCPPRVLGYHLETRTWLELQVGELIVIDEPKSNDAYEKLQLALIYKNLIKDLVQSHTSSTGKDPMMEDIVKGKGKGLVILLHGPPGVGKTLTAESVASIAGKPLFAVSPSDIGLDPADVEHNLEALFQLAARWRAVLLFDEADVFLESRSSNSADLTRNALVSVLLRVLEYYRGILILTTNRISQFDIAVQSRVNLGIKYSDLKDDQKIKIFEQFVKGVNPEKVEKRDEILEWVRNDTDASEWFAPLNGRQVRNVLFSASSLALKDNGPLKLEHIQKMAKTTSSFQKSLEVIVQRARDKNESG